MRPWVAGLTTLVQLRSRREQGRFRLIEYCLGCDPFSEQIFLALEIGFCVIDLGLRLQHASTGLVDLRLQRPRVDFRQEVSQLHLLVDSERYSFQLSGNLERYAADV